MGFINLPKNILSSTWAAKPSASTLSGYTILITDIGTNGALFVSNGTRWSPLGGQCLVAQSPTTTSVTGTVTETTLGSFVIPGGLMSANGQLEIKTLWAFTNSANAKTNRIRMNTLSGSQFISSGPATSDSGQYLTIIRNAAATNSQRGASSGISSFGATTAGFAVSSIDTTVDFNIVVSGQLSNTGETITLHHVSMIYLEG